MSQLDQTESTCNTCNASMCMINTNQKAKLKVKE